MLTAEMECAGAPLIPLCWKLQDTASQLFGFLRSGRMPPAAGSGAPAGDARCLRASSLGSGDSHADGTQLSNPTAASSESLPLAMSPSVSSRTSSTPGRSRLVAPGGWLTQVGDATVVLLRQLQAVAEHVDILTRLILTMTRGCSPDAFYNEYVHCGCFAVANSGIVQDSAVPGWLEEQSNSARGTPVRGRL